MDFYIDIGLMLLLDLQLSVYKYSRYLFNLILGSNLPAVSGLVLVITNSFFFIGFYSAYKVKHTKES